MVDRVARRYGTDPWTVLHWEPARLAVAIECVAAADAESAQRIERTNAAGGIVWPVVVVGGG